MRHHFLPLFDDAVDDETLVELVPLGMLPHDPDEVDTGIYHCIWADEPGTLPGWTPGASRTQ